MMWEQGWRERVWDSLAERWDIIVIGGGITGAGILREATRVGLKVLLLEANDFASGTSSRSGKMVHGGLRYLRNGDIKLTVESVRERERLLREGRGLVNPLGFLLANFADDRPPAWVFGFGLIVYDLLALKWAHRHYSKSRLRELCPQLSGPDLVGGFRYFDAITDDARLVLRVLREAVREGGTALNYARVEQLLRTRQDEVCGVVVRDLAPEGGGRAAEVRASVVMNATGAWADDLRAQVGGRARLRRLRGSHLVFPWAKLPLTRAVTWLHPRDRRALYALPWEGAIVVGTTDVDQSADMGVEPSVSDGEAEYIIEGVARAFPESGLRLADARSVFAGVRPVVNTGQADPSKESREFAIWKENGLLTVTGGKLTTFRLMALSALRAAASRLPGSPRFSARLRVLDEIECDLPADIDLSPAARLRLLGRYGADAPALIASARQDELARIGDSLSLWAELRWAARDEGVVHLTDLLLRRVRLGLLLPLGGTDLLEQIRKIVQPELGWDAGRWEQEVRQYHMLWNTNNSVPAR